MYQVFKQGLEKIAKKKIPAFSLLVLYQIIICNKMYLKSCGSYRELQFCIKESRGESSKHTIFKKNFYSEGIAYDRSMCKILKKLTGWFICLPRSKFCLIIRHPRRFTMGYIGKTGYLNFNSIQKQKIQTYDFLKIFYSEGVTYN